MSQVYIPPVTELTSSEDEGSQQAKPPVAKKARSDASRSSHGGTEFIQGLFTQACQCSKERARSNQSCFLKWKDSAQELQKLRDEFQSLHKIDQDQFKLWLNSIFINFV